MLQGADLSHAGNTCSRAEHTALSSNSLEEATFEKLAFPKPAELNYSARLPGAQIELMFHPLDLPAFFPGGYLMTAGWQPDSRASSHAVRATRSSLDGGIGRL